MLQQIFRNMPPVVKNLLIINVLMFLATLVMQAQGTDLRNILGLYNFKSPLFQPYQIVTYMFMHGDFPHLFFNMFTLVMFGTQLERVWGPKRFLIFYLVTGIGAVVLYSLIGYFEYLNLAGQMSQDEITYAFHVVSQADFLNSEGFQYYSENEASMIRMLAGGMVGASGAIYGLLLAFGVLFPNTELMLIFFPVPIKAKFFIPFLMILEFYLGLANLEGDNVAHFAHLSGALIGFILLKLWQRGRSNFY